MNTPPINRNPDTFDKSMFETDNATPTTTTCPCANDFNSMNFEYRNCCNVIIYITTNCYLKKISNTNIRYLPRTKFSIYQRTFRADSSSSSRNKK